MKERHTLLERFNKIGKGNRVIVSVLCICLIMVSLPVQYISLSAEASEGSLRTYQEIVSFSELPKEVSKQVVEVGTPFSELDLPDKLTVSCREVEEGNPDSLLEETAAMMMDMMSYTVEWEMLAQGSEEAAQEPEKSMPEESASELEALILADEGPESGTDVPIIDLEESVLDKEEPMMESGESVSEELAPEKREPMMESEEPVSEELAPEMGEQALELEKSVPETKEPAPEMAVPSSKEATPADAGEEDKGLSKKEIDGITWESTPEYNGETEGEYVFTAVLPDEFYDTYILPNDVELPKIVVTVEQRWTVYYFGADVEIEHEEYKAGSTVTVKSGEDLVNPIPKADKFLGWSETEGSSTVDFAGGEEIKNIQGDIRLYAVYKPTEIMTADFYSGGAGQTENVTVEVEKGAPSGTIKAPDLEAIEGWLRMGWATRTDQFEPVDYFYGDPIELTAEHTSFYGVYRKDVTLTYDANGGIGKPPAETLHAYINVNSEISEKPAEFTAAAGISQAGLDVMEWNTKEDGSGDSYKEGDPIVCREDLTLYAIYENAETKMLEADFYSGGAGQKENISLEVNQNATSGLIEAPELKEMEGFTPMGWNAKTNKYDVDYEPGSDKITLTDDLSAYYGVYRRLYSLSYDANGGDKVNRIVTSYCYANVHDEVTYQLAKFVVEPDITRAGYRFKGWNTRADGKGDDFYEGDRIKVMGNATLYAKWVPDVAEYKVEHYKQETDGSYVLGETEIREAFSEDNVSAKAKTYEGFTENVHHAARIPSGIVEGDGSLTLKLYYDRDTYEVVFDLNGADGNAPVAQKLRYGSCLQAMAAPSRKGYTFDGWYLDEEGTAGMEWDYNKTVEENFAQAGVGSSGNAGKRNNDATGSDGNESSSITLYAKWVDDIAPVLGDISFNQGYKNFLNWIIRQKDLIITVPITEEGSGVKQVNYSIWPDESAEGNARASDGTAEVQSKMGTLQIMGGRSSADRMNDVLSDNVYENGFGKMQILAEDGQIVAELTIDEDFKGQVVLSCIDHAGNVSAGKNIAAEGGLIVEDNAPSISFASEDGDLTEVFTDDVDVDVAVRDDVNESGEGNVTGGIAYVSYRIDGGKERDVSGKNFQKKMVEAYGFSVDISGEGTHTLTVRSYDNAGNESVESIDITIEKNPPASTPPQENGPEQNAPQENGQQKNGSKGSSPKGNEPKTGDYTHVEIYATAAMIAGLTYLLLYFMPEERGMTEKKKEELVSRLIRWAESGSRFRKAPAFIGIFFLLLYYHSIGKNVKIEWGERNVL